MKKRGIISLMCIGIALIAMPTNKAHAGDIQQGKATFYSVSSNGKARDDGGSFDNSKYIIGHKELPLNTRVRIKNLDTNKEMFITIDDNSEPGKQEADFIFSKALFVKFYRNDDDSLYKGIMPIEWEIIEELKKPLPSPTIQTTKKSSTPKQFIGDINHIGKTFPSTASFYSIRSTGKTLSNGTSLSNDHLVAGHKVLPIGTDVKIKNTDTNTEITVTIQDNKIPGKHDAEFIFTKKLFAKFYGNDLDSLYKGTAPIEYTILSYPEGTAIDFAAKRKKLSKSTPSQLRKATKQLRDLKKEHFATQNDELLGEIERITKQIASLKRAKRASLRIKKAEHAPFQEGIASYYADMFNGRGTANGEKFSNQDLTAAHRTLPFDTEVLVRNKRNGKTVSVRINDRGPYADTGNRVIDLSKAAFQAIAPLSNGLVPVELIYE